MNVHKLPAAVNDLEQAQARQHSASFAISSQPPPESDSGSSSSTGEDDDADWNDWVSDADDGSGQACTSLFDASEHGSLQAAIAYDKEKFGFDLQEVCAKLRLDFYARVRLVNFLRKTRPRPDVVKSLTGNEPLFTDDAYLVPVIQEDPYLRMGSDDWSDEDEEDAAETRVSNPEDKDREIRRLTGKLKQAKQDLIDFKQLVEQRFRSSEIAEAAREDQAARPPTSSTAAMVPKRDDDTHYFKSYGDNGAFLHVPSSIMALSKFVQRSTTSC